MKIGEEVCIGDIAVIKVVIVCEIYLIYCCGYMKDGCVDIVILERCNSIPVRALVFFHLFH
jgi:hypothetical protein